MVARKILPADQREAQAKRYESHEVTARRAGALPSKKINPKTLSYSPTTTKPTSNAPRLATQITTTHQQKTPPKHANPL
jgi:hypothetical protein